ncbi:MAG: tRNA pseudouridine(55) synthase TruB [Bacteroidetes bacterium]|nr:tRNA pseudouridine(55) synthase TruB [Bacteroidota bacterium]
MQLPSFQEFTEGTLLLVDKPKTWTSFDVVRKIRNLTRAKVGHGGTLDPLASGLMLIATGKFTKKLNDLTNLSKVYEGTFFLGATRPSFDKETEVDQHFEISNITDEEIHQGTKHFLGVIEQTPPIYSAIKIGGTAAYEFARKGEEVVMKSRQQEIYSFEIINIDLPLIHFKVHCSKGTYIRSLANDFGKALNNGAYLEELRRTEIGEYSLTNAWDLNDLVTQLIKAKEATTV